MHRIKYYPCLTHQGYQLSLVCTEKQCHENILICPMCEYSSHAQHHTIPIKVMLNQVEQAGSSSDDTNVLDVSLFLDRSHQECSRSIYRFQESLQNVSKLMSKKVDDYYANVKSQLRKFAETQIPSNIILDSLNQNLEQGDLEVKLKELLKLYAFTQAGSAHKLNLYSAVMAASENQINILNEKILEIQNDLDKKLDMIGNSFKTQQIQPTIAPEVAQTLLFTFSSTMKGANIVLSKNNMIAEQKTTESNGQRFIICEPGIPKTGITKYAFRIIKYAGWIGIGLCHKDVIVTANYKFHYTNIGHGSYLISNNAYSWSHLQKELNSAHKSFDFAAGDIIMVEVDITKKKVTWTKQKTTTKFTMDIDTNLELYPCANLCSPGDTVEILNKID